MIDGLTAPGYEPVRDAFLTTLADEPAGAGAAVAVYQHGRTVVDLWGGSAAPGTPWRRDTLQVVYSATKGVVAACVHLLVQRRQVDLDAPVATYWPEFAAAGKHQILLRHVLAHRAGLPALDRYAPITDVLTVDPVVTALAAQPPIWAPGTKHGYHGLTYGWLLGEVVRRVTGRTLGTFLTEEITAPLDLDFWIGLPEIERPRVSRTIPPPPPAPLPDLATLSEPERDIIRAYHDPESLTRRALIGTNPPMDFNDPAQQTAEIPAVNGIGTARGLAGLYAVLIGDAEGRPRLLDATTLATATTEQAAGIDEILKFPSRPALGFGLPDPTMAWYSPTAFGHPGYGGSLGYADPSTGIAFAYVTNRLDAGPLPDTRAASLLNALRALPAVTQDQ